MAERDRVCFSADSGLDAITDTNHLRHSGASSTSTATACSEEDAEQGGTPPAAPAAETSAGQPRPVGPWPEESPDQDAWAPRLRRDAGSTSKMQGAAAPSTPAQETGKTSAPSAASPPPGSSVQEIAVENEALSSVGITTPNRQTSEFGIAPPAQAQVAKEEVAAGAGHWHQRSAGLLAVNGKLDDSKSELERAVDQEAPGGIEVTSPTRRTSSENDKTHPTLSKMVVLPRDTDSSEKMPASAVAQLAGHEKESEEDSYLHEHDQDKGSEGGGEESDKQGFEYGGEQEEQEEQAEAKNRKWNSEGRQEAGQEQENDDAEEDEKGGAAPGGQNTHSVPSDNGSLMRFAQDKLAESSTPAGRVVQEPAESPQTGSFQHASALADSRQRYCSESKEGGENHASTQARRSTLMPVSTKITSNTRIVNNITEPPSLMASNTAATGRSNGHTGIHAAPGYVRRPSFMPGQAMRPARSAARASIQLSLPPVIAGPGSESACALSNATAIKAAQEAAEAAEEEPEDTGQPAEGQTWAEYHALNAGRQHSTSNLVSTRRHLRKLSVELFEEDDTDDTSSSGCLSSAGGEEDASDGERADKVDDPVSWQQSELGKSRMAQLTKATVAVESPAVKMSRKYLKLFAPSNSVRLEGFACFSSTECCFPVCSLWQEYTRILARFRPS